ncbi:esterase/lipase-like protein [Rhodopirellula maiorica SM1]|uniref:Esterase/lipase-like protein n=1 Tax=Rhodopirellula maiorica SM1 TaxID=1265738 RepID=M5RLC0_9BACT|nr:esterase/lipase-like protein [Rhodopirellula maiorica SM1]
MFVSLLVVGDTLHADDPAKDTARQERVPSAERLEQLLKRFPDADTNKDGVLNAQEVREYRAKVSERKSKQKQGDRATPTHADVSYGDHSRNVLDFYQVESDQPTPLIVYIHGGGFVGGDKRSINPKMVREANEAGISVASLHYRFVDGKEVLFPIPQHDCARALQFLRSKADAWNIDPKRVAVYGGSAGAGISMWLGFHDDLADPSSDDLVARQSTRFVAIGTMGGQGTYDPIKIKKLVGGRAWEHPSIYLVYGNHTAEETLNPTPEKQSLYDEASAITHLTKDDPPLYMIYSEPDVVPPKDSRPGQFIHHPNFGKQLQQAMDQLDIKNVYAHTSTRGKRNLQSEMLDFFREAFASVKD